LELAASLEMLALALELEVVGFRFVAVLLIDLTPAKERAREADVGALNIVNQLFELLALKESIGTVGLEELS